MSLERKRPEIEFPEGQPPTALVVTDEIVGDGAEAASGTTVTAHYVGVAFSGARSSTRPGTGASRCGSVSASGRSSRAGTRASPG